MTVQDLMGQIQQLDNREWQELLTFVVSDETDRRKQLPAVEAAQAELIGELVEAGDITGPETTTPEEATTTGTAPAWVNPGTNHAKMYLAGAVVEHGGKLWQSTHSGLNSWEPGTENGLTWKDITPAPIDEETGEPEVPEFKQPTGAHDAYAKGDRVRFNGAVYESLIAANTYSPSAYPAGWRKL